MRISKKDLERNPALYAVYELKKKETKAATARKREERRKSESRTKLARLLKAERGFELQKHVSEATGIPRTNISQYENGHHIPSAGNLDRLIEFYNKGRGIDAANLHSTILRRAWRAEYNALRNCRAK